MKHKRFIVDLSDPKLRCLLMVCGLLIICLSQAAHSQSGRRRNTGSPTPSPVTVQADTKEEVKPAPAKPAPIASLIVGGNSFGASMDIPSSYLDIAIDACIGRLKEAASLAVSGGGSRMTRKDAIDDAKRQKEALVVWLEMKVDDPQRGANGIVIGFTIFAPQTGAVKGFGEVYLDSNRMGTGRVGVGLPKVANRVPLEYLMRDGGRNVADRVMQKLNVGLIHRGP
jgi:hypothetical protein